jgi:hypothetical protein
LYTVITDFEPSIFDCKVPAIFINEIFGDKQLIGIVKNNLLNEFLGILVIVSSLFVAFSKEKYEDEFILKIRLESLVWAVYINYGVLLFSIIFIYDLAFFWIMLFNMFTILFFFIIRFNWQISKLNNSTNHEK